MIFPSENSQNSAPILGNYAESSPYPENRGFEPIQGKTSKWDFDAKISELYALQIQARKSMLEHFYSLPDSEKLDQKKAHRVCNCRRDLRPVLSDVSAIGKPIYEISKPQIFKHNESGNTFFGGLQLCGSPYACPVCSPKISEKRAAEIRKAVTDWNASGGICLFITLTFPHSSDDSLPSLVKRFKGALERFRKGAMFDKIKQEIGYFGLIRSLEITWGEANGWHPHSHEIWFVKPNFLDVIKNQSDFILTSSTSWPTLNDFFLEQFKLRLFDRWRTAVVASGLSAPSFERGMDIKIAETEDELTKRLSEYLAKTGVEESINHAWGVDDELTKMHSKRGKPGRYTPFDFLRHQYNPELTKSQKYRFRCLFAEYVNSFKGVAKIFWSRGLKAHFSVSDLTDEQLADEQTEQSSLCYEVPPPIWVFVIGINDHRAQLLLKVKNEGVQAAKDYLSGLLDTYVEYFDEKYDLLPINLQHILEYYADTS